MTDATDNRAAIEPHAVCLICGPGRKALHGDDYPHPGFGQVSLLADGEHVWSTVTDYEVRVADIDRATRGKRTKHRWTLLIDGPMVTREFDRQRGGHWVLVAERRGFA